MARILRRITLVVLLVVVPRAALAQEVLDARATVVPESVGMSTERLDRLRAVFADYVDGGELVGAVVLVARRGQTVLLDAFGHRDREAGAAQQTDDIFRIASQSKAIVSAAIMILQEEGRLLLSHPVARFLPEFAETTVAVSAEEGGYEIVPARRPITIRDLLTHTSGFSYGTGLGSERWQEAGLFGWYFADRDEPIRETVRRMAALPAAAQPGERFVYGYSTDILGAVVEVVSGQPLDAFLRERIFEPLGMADTCFYLPPDQIDRLAVVYSATGAGLERAADPGSMVGLSHVGQGHYVEGPRASFSGGAGLLSTARDYARFLQAMLDGGQLDGTRILSPKSVELMVANHVGELLGADSGNGFGLGFLVTDDLGETGALGSEGQFGWGGAYHSTYWADPAEDLVVVYFTQLIPAGPIDDHDRLRALVYQAIVESGPR